MSTLDDWIAEVQLELGTELDLDTDDILDLTREVAHTVARPAAPLTTFLVGYAAARSGGGGQAVQSATDTVRSLVERRQGAAPEG